MPKRSINNTENQMAKLLCRIRTESNLTQYELAKKMNSAQESISRAEKIGCSFNFVLRAAEACGKKIIIDFSSTN